MASGLHMIPGPLKSLLVRSHYFRISQKRKEAAHGAGGEEKKNAAHSLYRTPANIFVSCGVNRMRLGAAPPVSVSVGTSQIAGEAVAFEAVLFTLCSCVL